MEENRREAKFHESIGLKAGEIPVFTRTDSQEDKTPEGGCIEKGKNENLSGFS